MAQASEKIKKAEDSRPERAKPSVGESLARMEEFEKRKGRFVATVQKMIARYGAFGFLLLFDCAANAEPKTSSGVYGYVMYRDTQPTSEQPLSHLIDRCEVIIKDARTYRIIKRVRSNKAGNFKVSVPPGRYIILPYNKDYVRLALTDKTYVTVWPGFYSKAVASFNGGW